MTPEDRAIWRWLARGTLSCGLVKIRRLHEFGPVLTHISGAQDMADYALIVACMENPYDFHFACTFGDERIDCRGIMPDELREVVWLPLYEEPAEIKSTSHNGD